MPKYRDNGYWKCRETNIDLHIATSLVWMYCCKMAPSEIWVVKKKKKKTTENHQTRQQGTEGKEARGYIYTISNFRWFKRERRSEGREALVGDPSLGPVEEER